MLRRMRGKSHSVLTALALRQKSTGLLLQDVCHTQVLMRTYSDAEIECYIQSGDYRDKDGGYAIQHKAFHPVAAVRGCYANVMGLPLCNLTCLLQPAGIAVEVDIPQACQRHLGITFEVYPQILAVACHSAKRVNGIQDEKKILICLCLVLLISACNPEIVPSSTVTPTSGCPHR